MPSINNIGGASPPEQIRPHNGAAGQDQQTGRFNEQSVAVVNSGKIDSSAAAPDSFAIGAWKNDKAEASAAAAPPEQLHDAAKTARKGGLLQLLRSAVKAVIDFFIRNLDLSGPSPENLQKLVASKSMSNLLDTNEQIGRSIKKLENPKKTSTFEIVRQEAKKLKLPDRATVEAIATPENVRHITEDCSEKMKEDFQTAADLLKQVYDTKIKLAYMEKGKSFGQLIKDAQKSIATPDQLKPKDDQVLRNWMAFALQCVDQCSQVMIDTSHDLQTNDPNLLARTKNDVKQFATTPADKLPITVMKRTMPQ